MIESLYGLFKAAGLKKGELQGFGLAAGMIFGVIAFGPLTGSRLFPLSARSAVAVSIAFSLYGVVNVELSNSTFLLMLGQQVVMGAVTGWCAGLIFHAFQSAGRITDDVRGMAQVSSLDPSMASYTSQFGMFFFLLACLLFFTSPAYRIFIIAIINLSSCLPGDSCSDFIFYGNLIVLIKNFFTTVLLLSFPFCLVFFIADIASGIINRSLPQLNVYFIMHQVKILLGLLVVLLLLNIPENFSQFIILAITEFKKIFSP